MTNGGVFGWPSPIGGLPDKSVTPGKLSVPQGWGILYPGRYYFTVAPGPTNTNAGLGIGSLRVSPWFVPNTCTVSRLGAEVTTIGDAGSKVRLGIYADDGTGYPGVLVIDAGTIAGDSATVQDTTISTLLQPGLYWVGGAVQIVSTTQPTLRIPNAASGAFGMMNMFSGTSTPIANQSFLGLSATGVTGALPNMYPSGQSPTSSVLRTHVKIS